MKGTPAVYLGRIIDKKHFRAFVYGVNGEKKLVESWDEFEAAMETGLWFATQEDAKNVVVPIEKPKSVKRVRTKAKQVPQVQVEENDESAQPIENNGMVFEVTDENN